MGSRGFILHSSDLNTSASWFSVMCWFGGHIRITHLTGLEPLSEPLRYGQTLDYCTTLKNWIMSEIASENCSYRWKLFDITGYYFVCWCTFIYIGCGGISFTLWLLMYIKAQNSLLSCMTVQKVFIWSYCDFALGHK